MATYVSTNIENRGGLKMVWRVECAIYQASYHKRSGIRMRLTDENEILR